MARPANVQLVTFNAPRKWVNNKLKKGAKKHKKTVTDYLVYLVDQDRKQLSLFDEKEVKSND